MTKENTFLIYCIERYKYHKQMTGKDVILLFERYGVTDYILDCYEALHTTGEQYLLADIDAFLETHQTA